VPAAAQSALRYGEFVSAFEDDRPVYGLNPLGLDGAAPHDSVEEMARHYIAEIRVLRPEGPYVVGGVCFGAHVAFEMALQLHEGGYQVPLVVILDYGAPVLRPLAAIPTPVLLVRFASYYAGRVTHHLRNRSFRRAAAYRLHRLSERLRHQHEVDLAPLHRLAEAHAKAHQRYRARVWHGDVLLVTSEEFGRQKLRDRWALVTAGNVEAVTLPATKHLELLVRHGAAVARVVSEALRRIEQTAGDGSS
jgi:thioesterase domain-containing protein